MAKILDDVGTTFQEYSVLPGYTPAECTIKNIDLTTDLAGISLKVPLLSAAMTSVTGYDMALALGKEGGIAVLPTKLPVDDQVDIIRRIKNYEMSFVDDPAYVRDYATIEDAVNMIEQRGHSKIPVVDRNNVFLGMFTLEHYLETSPDQSDSVVSAMIGRDEILCREKRGISVKTAKNIIRRNHANYLVILDRQYRLQKLAFKKDIDKINIASAISTHEGWRESVDATVAAGVDMIVIDTSDGYNEFMGDVLRELKGKYPSLPVCAGNVVTYDGARFLFENGADIVKVGMSSGSICITQREKAVGRAPMSALIDVARCRDDYYAETGRYIPAVIDGGIISAADLVVAFTKFDAAMVGGYLNKFYEAAGEKLDEHMKETTIESRMRWVATWGEGSARAQNLARYGHKSTRTFFVEGVEGRVPYAGRLKPSLRKDILKIKAALSNVGAMNLKEYREKAVLERLSPFSSAIISQPHDVIVKS